MEKQYTREESRAIAKKGKMTPEEEKEFDVIAQAMVDNLNRNVSKE